MTSAWRGLGGLDAYRITEIPRRPEAAENETPQRQPNDPGRMQRLAALIAAYHAGVGSRIDGTGALAIGWVRNRAGGPVQLLTAGQGLVGSGRDGEL